MVKVRRKALETDDEGSREGVGGEVDFSSDVANSEIHAHACEASVRRPDEPVHRAGVDLARVESVNAKRAVGKDEEASKEREIVERPIYRAEDGESFGPADVGEGDVGSVEDRKSVV